MSDLKKQIPRVAQCPLAELLLKGKTLSGAVNKAVVGSGIRAARQGAAVFPQFRRFSI